MVIIYRQFYLLVLCATLILCSDTHAQRSDRVLIGAIRWDAWYRAVEGVNPGPVGEVQRTLSPGKYHFRAPFFTEELSDTSIRIIGYDNDIIGKEIAYASAAGLDYWAFLLYDETYLMSEGLNIYLRHKDRAKINFCAIAEPKRLCNSEGKETERILRLLQEPNYQKVLGNRPLIYIFRPDTGLISSNGGEEIVRQKFKDLRAAIAGAGHADPYLVIMSTETNITTKMLDLTSADAVSEYAYQSDLDRSKTTYQDLCNEAKEFWLQQKNSGYKSIPLVMSGWNRWPRIERPVSWEANWQTAPGIEITKNYDLPTPKELAKHVKEGIDWVIENPQSCPAKSILIYAWNEHDEGGWLCPTFQKDSSPDDSRLKMLKKVLDQR